MKLKRVVVTGLGALTPIGNNTHDYWNSLVNGVSGADTITRFDTSKFKTKFACELKGFDAADHFDRKEARKYDRYAQYGLVCSDEAIKDAGIDTSQIDLDRVGVIWSSGIGGIDTFAEEMINFAHGDGTPRFNPFFIPKMIADIAAGHISIRHGFMGPNFATVSACASSANAIVDAFYYIGLGKADMFVCGGSEASLSPTGIGGFNAMHAISTRNDDPKTASRPFDKDRDGFVMAEGGGALILEELEHALKRGAKIYAEIVGAGLSADAYHITGPHPEGEGARKSMKYAIEEAGLQLNEIDHINTHGTSTPLGDISEPKAIVNLFGENAYKISINSTKSMTGHLLGAAGAAEAIATILAVQNDIIPPTINHFTDDPDIDNRLDFTFHMAKKRVVNAALTNTFGLIRGLFSPDKKLFLQIRNVFGFYPGNLSLYHLAFRHKSLARKQNNGIRISNERLEFLGDAILDAVVADYLFKLFPYKDEGFLTQMKSKIVSRAHLNKLSAKLGIDKLIQCSQECGPHYKSMKGDAFEAFIGALYLDKGFSFTKRIIVDRIIRLHIDMDELIAVDLNYKSRLLEWVQRERKALEFRVIEEVGSGYNKQYIVESLINQVVFGRGQDFSIKAAEQQAAERALELIAQNEAETG